VRVPPGYTALMAGARRALVRDDLVPRLGPWLLRVPLAPPPGATPIAGGRGGTFRIDLDTGAVVVRFGRRGGIVARLVRDWYVGVRPRPWDELAVSLAARGRGAPVPEVVAACVHGWGAYRSAVITGEIVGARSLVVALHAAPTGATRDAVARAAGIAVGKLHRAGVVHADLNLTNILVPGGEVPAADAGASIVDLDRARIRPGRLAPRVRRRSLRRLLRSAAKLDPGGEVVDTDVRRLFHEAYAHALESACGS
jgi:3-deoxy-D-manno-octulosonic acid kinase